MEQYSQQDTGRFVGDFREEALGLITTLARYTITVGPMARRVKNDQSILPISIATLALDVADGEITRFVSQKMFDSDGDDTPIRRITDGVLDHATVGRVGWEVAKKNPTSRPYLGILAGRAALAAAGLNGYHLAKTGEVTKGRKWQKATHLSTAIFGLAANGGNRHLTHLTGFAASSVAMLTVPAHLKDLGLRGNQRFREL